MINELAQFFYEKGDMQKTVETAKEGMDKADGPKTALYGFLRDHYQKRGDYVQALEYYRKYFQAATSIKVYRELKGYCRQEDWTEVENECIQFLSRKNRTTILAEIHLYEKRYDLVLQFLRGEQGHWWGDMDRFADAISGQYPEEIIIYYQNKVRQHIKRKKDRRMLRLHFMLRK